MFINYWQIYYAFHKYFIQKLLLFSGGESMKKLLLPALAFVVFLLVCSCDAKAISDEEIVNAMLDLLPTPETIP
ncbi:MAG: hypothetical protein DRN29_05105, partial [Thermoplasmata archaeon]